MRTKNSDLSDLQMRDQNTATVEPVTIVRQLGALIFLSGVFEPERIVEAAVITFGGNLEREENY